MKNSNLHNTDLINLIGRDKQEAFRVIYDNYYESLCFYANRMLNNLDESEDVVQNIIIKLWENRENLETIVNVKSYLFRATYNSCLNIISRLGKKQIYQNESWLKLKEIEMEERDSLVYAELEKIVNKLIDELPDQCQRVFKMNRFEEKSYKEIAQELNITVKAVEGNISRALQKMRLGLRDYLYLILLMYFK